MFSGVRRQANGARSSVTIPIPLPSIPPRTFTLRSAAWLRKGNPDAAVRDFDAAIRLDPKLSTAYRDRGIVTANNGEWVKSIADLDQAILLSPGDGLAFAQRGRARAAQSETARAIEDFDEATRSTPRPARERGSRDRPRARTGFVVGDTLPGRVAAGVARRGRRIRRAVAVGSA